MAARSTSLVTCAGIIRDNLLFKMSDDDWDAVIDTHLKGTFFAVRAAQKRMVEQKSGKIVLVSSTSALGNRGQTNYSTAKAGLQGMTKTLAIELGPFNVNVNCVAPGFIETAMTRQTAERMGVPFDQFAQAASEQTPLRRVGQPEDVAGTIAFLCSEDAGYVSGQVIYVAGGPRNETRELDTRNLDRPRRRGHPGDRPCALRRRRRVAARPGVADDDLEPPREAHPGLRILVGRAPAHAHAVEGVSLHRALEAARRDGEHVEPRADLRRARRGEPDVEGRAAARGLSRAPGAVAPAGRRDRRDPAEARLHAVDDRPLHCRRDDRRRRGGDYRDEDEPAARTSRRRPTARRLRLPCDGAVKTRSHRCVTQEREQLYANLYNTAA